MKNLFTSTACLKGDKSYDRVINEFLDNNVTNIELTGVHPFMPIDKLEKKINFLKKKAQISLFIITSHLQKLL